MCQAEVEKGHGLDKAVHATEDVGWSPSADRLARLLERIDAAEARHARSSRWWQRMRDWCMGDRSWWQRTPPRMRWALAAQGAMILLLVSVIVWQSMLMPKSFYRMLADVSESVPHDQMQIRVVFADDMTIQEQEMRELLTAAGGTIVQGPSLLGVYTVEVAPPEGSPDRMNPILDAVRAHPKARLAEPVIAR
jgi:hypothetical protein